MVDFIKSAHKRTVLANILHILFYVVYVLLVLFLIVLFPTAPWAALAVVLLSKWRVISVRPRYWWANILSNLTDTMLGLGVVILMWVSSSLPIQIILALAYIVWLVSIKPQHKRHIVVIQAGVAQFVALWALFSVGYMIPLFVLVMTVFVIGFGAARHALSAYDEVDRGLLASVWGFVIAQLGFVAWHWTIAYSITSTLKIPQIAIIIAALAFLAEKSYVAWRNDQKISWNEIKWPAAFVGIVLVMLLFFFSGLWDASTL